MTLSDADLQQLRPNRGRGLRQLAKRVGDVRPIIKAALAARREVRVLDLGCGFGTTLIELAQTAGERVELHGLNKNSGDGDCLVMQRNAVLGGTVSAKAMRRMRVPTLHFGDADNGLPFDANCFDVVFSQVAFFHFREKAHVVEEVHRILRPGGVARLDVMIERPELPVPYSITWHIVEEDRAVGFWEFVERFEALVKGVAYHRPYLEIRKTGALRLGLSLIQSIRLNEMSPNWWGTNSYYAVQRSAVTSAK